MSRKLPLLLALLAALPGAPARAATPVIRDIPVAAPAPPDAMALARRFAARRTRSDCIAEALESADIIVCAPLRDQALPLPELYGPVPGSTDGAAVDPYGVPCGASLSNNCYTGLDLIASAGAVIGMISLLIDPDQNLGEGTAIPERFRGANR